MWARSSLNYKLNFRVKTFLRSLHAIYYEGKGLEGRKCLRKLKMLELIAHCDILSRQRAAKCKVGKAVPRET
jgi:hypothetical protein